MLLIYLLGVEYFYYLFCYFPLIFLVFTFLKQLLFYVFPKEKVSHFVFHFFRFPPYMSWYTVGSLANQIAEHLIYGGWLYYKNIYTYIQTNYLLKWTASLGEVRHVRVLTLRAFPREQY